MTYTVYAPPHPRPRVAAIRCRQLIAFILIANGLWDVASATCICWGRCGWLSHIHLDILSMGDDYIEPLAVNAVGYWVLTNGCIRLLAGFREDTGTEAGAFVTYIVEGIAFAITVTGEDSGRGKWVAIVSFVCAVGVGLRACARRNTRRVFPAEPV